MQTSVQSSIPDLHAIPVFYPHRTRLIWISHDGEITYPSQAQIADELALGPVLLCHRQWSAARAGVDIELCFDLLDLI